MRSFLVNLLVLGIAGCSVLPFVGGDDLPEPEKFEPDQESEVHQYASKQHANLRSGATGLSISPDMYENLNYGDAVRTEPVEVRGLDVELPEDPIVANAERDILNQNEEEVKKEVEEQKIAESAEKEEEKLKEEQRALAKKQAEEKAKLEMAKAEEAKKIAEAQKIEETPKAVEEVVQAEEVKPVEAAVEKQVEQVQEVVAETKPETKPVEQKVGENVTAIAPVEVAHEVGKEHTSVVEGAFKEERSAQLKTADQMIADKMRMEQAEQMKKEAEETRKKVVKAEQKPRKKPVKQVAKTADDVDVEALLNNASDLNDEYVNKLVNEAMSSSNTDEVNEFLKHSKKSEKSVEQNIRQQKTVVKKQSKSKPVVQKSQEKTQLKVETQQREVIKLKPLKRKLKIKEIKADDDFEPIYID